MQLELNGRPVGDGHPPYIVAEIGQNHNGDSYTAIRLCGMAAKCGADAVKFQLRDCEAEYTPEELDKPHPHPENAFGETYREHRQALDLSAADLAHIARRIQYNEWALTWFATPCHLDAVDQLEGLGVPFYKVASKDLTNYELLAEIALTKKPVILSTGMDGLREISDALSIINDDKVIVLQCTSCYPCEPEDVHLLAMQTIRDEFGVLVGLSDHTVGVPVSSAAVALGACLIEKHITLSRAMPGTDHAGSLEEDGLRRVVRNARVVYEALGNSAKIRLACTDAARLKLRGENA